MSLSGFLPARIAEDKWDTFELVPYGCEPGCCAPAGWVGHRCLICGTTEYGGTVEAITAIAREHAENVHQRSRWLAECEAKRRIVAMLSPGSMLGADYEGWWEAHDAVMRELAQPYAGHPDFLPEWRNAQ